MKIEGRTEKELYESYAFLGTESVSAVSFLDKSWIPKGLWE